MGFFQFASLSKKTDSKTSRTKLKRGEAKQRHSFLFKPLAPLL